MSQRVIRIDHSPDGDWVMAGVGGVFAPQRDHVIALHRDGAIAGGVVYCMFTGAVIFLHMRGSEDNWATRDFLWMIFDYGFNQLGCRKLMGLVDASNIRALDVDLRLGFRLINKLYDMMPDGSDILILEMTRADYAETPWAKTHILNTIVVARSAAPIQQE